MRAQQACADEPRERRWTCDLRAAVAIDGLARGLAALPKFRAQQPFADRRLGVGPRERRRGAAGERGRRRGR